MVARSAGTSGKQSKGRMKKSSGASSKGVAARVSDLLRVGPGPVDLSRHDPASTPGVPGDRAATEADMAAAAPIVSDLQEALYAEGVVGSTRRRLLLVLQGMDTSGKDGATRHVDGMMNPQGLRITSFKAPTRIERRHDFLWRIARAVPSPGLVGVFNRSQYEDVLVVRVHDLVPESEWSTRYDSINAFEHELQDDGVHLLKVFLHISRQEQQQRLLARLDDPSKTWKYNPADVNERAFWDDYMAAYTDVLERCSTAGAPWYLVPADRKWYRIWAVGRLVLEALQDMAPSFPPPDFDVSVERSRVLASS
jgi:PPK2 family polyphosphate:nucleotide phosphotransferase